MVSASVMSPRGLAQHEAAASSSSSAAVAEPELLDVSPEVLDFLGVDFADLNNTQGSQAVHRGGSSLVELFKEVAKIPNAKATLLPRFKELGFTFRDIIHAYVAKNDELVRVSMKLDAIKEAFQDLTLSVSACRCGTNGSCADCVCSKKDKGYHFCTDRCGCGAKCTRSQGKQKSGLIKIALANADEFAEKHLKKLRKKRKEARIKADAAVDAARKAVKEAKQQRKDAEKRALEEEEERAKQEKARVRQMKERVKQVKKAAESESEEEKPKKKKLGGKKKKVVESSSSEESESDSSSESESESSSSSEEEQPKKKRGGKRR